MRCLLAWPLLVGLAGGYPWLAEMEPGERGRLDEKFAAPGGFTRVETVEGSFAAWLRKLPLRADRTAVRSYDGTPLVRPSAAIVALDVGKRDLQQCADSALRLHAEFLWSTGRADMAAYHFTSGDRSSWKDWAGGERFVVAGANVRRVRTGTRATGRVAWRAWLEHLFRYAGTRSLRHDLDPVPRDAPIEAGDVFDAPGNPGHAVVILDVAADAAGERIALVGQGFIPAEDFHVLMGSSLPARDCAGAPRALRGSWDLHSAGAPLRALRGSWDLHSAGAPLRALRACIASGDHVVDGVWFRLPNAGGKLYTPLWEPFARDDALRFRIR